MTFAQHSSSKRRTSVEKRGKTAGHGHGAQEQDVFIRKIHTRPINKKYVLDCKLGEGRFAMVILGMDDTQLPLHLECVDWPRELEKFDRRTTEQDTTPVAGAAKRSIPLLR